MEAHNYFAGRDLELARAIDRDDLEGMKAAIEHGAQVNAVGTSKMSPAMYAVAQLKKRAYEFLIRSGANLSSRAEDKNSAATLAVRLAKRDPDWLRLTVDLGKVDPNTKMPNGGPLLEYFVVTDNPSAIEYLVARGADPNAQGSSDIPLIASTAYAGRYGLVELLLKNGATAHNALLQKIAERETMLDTAPGTPEWQARERVRALLRNAPQGAGR